MLLGTSHSLKCKRGWREREMDIKREMKNKLNGIILRKKQG